MTGLLHGNAHQLVLQLYGALFIIAINVVGTIILRVVSLFVALRMDEATPLVGDDAVHGEEAYALYGDGRRLGAAVPAGVGVPGRVGQGVFPPALMGVGLSNGWGSPVAFDRLPISAC